MARIEEVVNKQHGQLDDAFHGRSNGRSTGNGGGVDQLVLFSQFFHAVQPLDQRSS